MMFVEAYVTLPVARRRHEHFIGGITFQ